eukprot:1159994-Pelagomonas_calceolata.AAC.4
MPDRSRSNGCPAGRPAQAPVDPEHQSPPHGGAIMPSHSACTQQAPRFKQFYQGWALQHSCTQELRK